MWELHLCGSYGTRAPVITQLPFVASASWSRIALSAPLLQHRRQPRQQRCRCIRAQHQASQNSDTTSVAQGPWKKQHDETTVLIADIGGTNCRFELWTVDGDASSHKQILKHTYETKDYPTFQDALSALCTFKEFQAYLPQSVALAVAGPVKNNVCEMTNLSWIIDGNHLTQKYGVSVGVLNDFEANGYGVLALQPSDIVTLNDVPVLPQGPKAVLGPGTGLGEAQLMWDQGLGGYRVWPSEGAHAQFAPRGWRQRALQAYVESQMGYCEVEHVACGSGLERIYQFLQTDKAYNRCGVNMIDQKKAPDITKEALEESNPLSEEAVDLFLAIIGAEAGYMGVRALASGGIYICGGITPRLIPRIQMGGLMESFMHKRSKFNKLLRTYPVYAVMHKHLGLLGTKEYAIRLLDSRVSPASLCTQ